MYSSCNRIKGEEVNKIQWKANDKISILHNHSTHKMAPRQSYAREFKLQVVQFYHSANLYQTRKKYNLDSKTILRWVKQESELILSRAASKRVKGSRTAILPQLEKELKKDIDAQREKGLRVKRWWIMTRAKELKKQMCPQSTIHFSRGWFQRFKKRHHLSYRQATSVAQNPPEHKKETIREFHRFIRRNCIRGAGKRQRERPLGVWKDNMVANMDQTPMPFVFGGGKTYTEKGAKTVWIRGGQSGQDKRQCTVQLTIFADGEPRVKPMIIFRGTGKKIKDEEKAAWDNRVHVKFQDNAWCDESMMLDWVDELWAPAIQKENGKSLLVADVHAAQKTEHVLGSLKKIGTTLALIPPGCTSLIQPLDVVFNRAFKQKCGDLFNKHMEVIKYTMEIRIPSFVNFSPQTY